MTIVERVTRCVVGWCVGAERSEAVLQDLVDQAPQAFFYFSDAFSNQGLRDDDLRLAIVGILGHFDRILNGVEIMTVDGHGIPT